MLRGRGGRAKESTNLVLVDIPGYAACSCTTCDYKIDLTWAKGMAAPELRQLLIAWARGEPPRRYPRAVWDLCELRSLIDARPNLLICASGPCSLAFLD